MHPDLCPSRFSSNKLTTVSADALLSRHMGRVSSDGKSRLHHNESLLEENRFRKFHMRRVNDVMDTESGSHVLYMPC